jgi:hypothetical protein
MQGMIGSLREENDDFNFIKRRKDSNGNGQQTTTAHQMIMHNN